MTLIPAQPLHSPKPHPHIAPVPAAQLDAYVAWRVEGPYEWHYYCEPCSMPVLRSTIGSPPRPRLFREVNLYEIYSAPVALKCSTCGKPLWDPRG